MTTITIPINDSLKGFIEDQVKLGHSASKAELVRVALQRYKEDLFIKEVLAAKQEIIDGQGLTGDLDALAEGF